MPEPTNHTDETPNATPPVTPPVTPPATPPTPTTTNYEEIFTKLNTILDKRTDGLAKSALKDNGFGDDEIKDILTSYRASKQEKQTSAATTLNTLKQENDALKAQMQKSAIDTAAQKVAIQLGVELSTVPYVTKLADLTKAVNDKGEVDEKLLSDALTKVLADLPQLKGTATPSTGFQQIGAGAPQAPPAPKPQGAQKRWNRFNH